MLRYNYVAKDLDGAVVEGIMDADDKREVRDRLRRRGFYATSVAAIHERHLLKRQKKVKREEIAIFAEQLAVMIDAGLHLVRCLITMAQQTKNAAFKQIINEIRHDIENGVSFADALSKHPKVFPSMFVNLVRSGEIGGVMSKVLYQLSDYLNKEQRTKRMIKAALAYPKIVATLCMLTAIFMLSFVVPRFATLYNDLGLKLPLPTLILVGASRLVLKFWWAILGGGVGIVLAYMRFSASSTGRAILDRIALRLPIFGDLNRKVVVSRFVRILGILDISGVPIMQSLEMAEQVADNVVLSHIIEGVRTNVRAGGNIEEPIAATNVFPPMVVQMVALGEETGKLGESLEKGADYLDQELDETVKQLIARLEPMLTIAIAAMVGLFAMAIYLPMFDVIKGMSG